MQGTWRIAKKYLVLILPVRYLNESDSDVLSITLHLLSAEQSITIFSS